MTETRTASAGISFARVRLTATGKVHGARLREGAVVSTDCNLRGARVEHAVQTEDAGTCRHCGY